MFQFGNVVVVGDDQIGVIVKSWSDDTYEVYEVYVREYNAVRSYESSEIKHFVYSKHLSADEYKLYN